MGSAGSVLLLLIQFPHYLLMPPHSPIQKCAQAKDAMVEATTAPGWRMSGQED